RRARVRREPPHGHARRRGRVARPARRGRQRHDALGGRTGGARARLPPARPRSGSRAEPAGGEWLLPHRLARRAPPPAPGGSRRDRSNTLPPPARLRGVGPRTARLGARDVRLAHGAGRSGSGVRHASGRHVGGGHPPPRRRPAGPAGRAGHPVAGAATTIRRSRWPAVLLAIAIGSAYAPAFPGAFHFDDWHVIQDNPHVRRLASIPRFFVDPDTTTVLHENKDLRPVLMATFAINYAVSGLVP